MKNYVIHFEMYLKSNQIRKLCYTVNFKYLILAPETMQSQTIQDAHPICLNTSRCIIQPWAGTLWPPCVQASTWRLSSLFWLPLLLFLLFVIKYSITCKHQAGRWPARTCELFGWSGRDAATRLRRKFAILSSPSYFFFKPLWVCY